MLPVLLEIGPIKIHSYGLLIAIGFLVSLHFVRRDAAKAGLNPDIFTNMAFWALPLGIAGTRIAFIMMYPQYFSWDKPLDWFAIWKGGLVFQGAIPLALPFIYFYLRRNSIPFLKACDIFVPYVPLGHAFGRLGCFMYGCCYGKPSSLPWAIPARRVPWDTSVKPEGSPAYLDHLERFGDVAITDQWSHPIHPTQLYSAAGLLLMCWLLLCARRRWPGIEGVVLGAYFLLYGLYCGVLPRRP
jgi:phosphatidylglycerol:prolipoprotein diacylglycerol transferase